MPIFRPNGNCSRNYMVATRGITQWGRKWRVRVWVPGEGYRHIGLFLTLDAAVSEYRKAKRELLGETVLR